jgi:hypothetical protein
MRDWARIAINDEKKREDNGRERNPIIDSEVYPRAVS